MLDENAIRLSVSIGKEETSVNLSVMKSDWQKGLALLQEILTRPGFDEKVLDVMKKQLLTGLARQGEAAPVGFHARGDDLAFCGSSLRP